MHETLWSKKNPGRKYTIPCNEKRLAENVYVDLKKKKYKDISQRRQGS